MMIFCVRAHFPVFFINTKKIVYYISNDFIFSQPFIISSGSGLLLYITLFLLLSAMFSLFFDPILTIVSAMYAT